MKRFKLFGVTVIVSRASIKAQERTGKCRSRLRHEVKRQRLEQAGNRCEKCGREIDMRCSLHHRLPVGAENRNAVENVLVLCSACHHRLQAVQHTYAINYMELMDDDDDDCERYEGVYI